MGAEVESVAIIIDAQSLLRAIWSANGGVYEGLSLSSSESADAFEIDSITMMQDVPGVRIEISRIYEAETP